MLEGAEHAAMAVDSLQHLGKRHDVPTREQVFKRHLFL